MRAGTEDSPHRGRIGWPKGVPRKTDGRETFITKIRVTRETRDRLAEHAARTGRSQSEILGTLAERFLAEQAEERLVASRS